MEKVNITLNKETIDLMKKIKVTHRYKTYDNLILSAAKILSNSEITGEKSKADILLKNDYDLLKRQEQFFKRLGALETKYFKNILDISESLKELNLKNYKVNEDIKNSKKNTDNDTILKNSNEEKLIRELEFLKNHSNELELSIKKKQEKINTLQKKIVKSSGVFSSGYEMKLSETEYKEIFE